MTSEQKFWQKVDKNGPVPPHKPEIGNCWLWLGAKRKHGHGYFNYNSRRGLPHRFSYELHFGEIPKGLWVLHHCDRGDCIRPDHLFVGTQADNMRDCSEKGRTYHGERVKNVKLTEAQAAEIYCLYHRDRVARPMLALEFGVCQGVIARIAHGIAWRHVTKNFTFPRRRGFSGPSAKE